MSKGWLAVYLVFFLICVSIFVISLKGCSETGKGSALPQGATIVKDYCNGWLLFSLDGNSYLFCKKNKLFYRGYMAITQVTE